MWLRLKQRLRQEGRDEMSRKIREGRGKSRMRKLDKMMDDREEQGAMVMV